MADVFISHAHNDREPVKVIAKALEDHGFSVWYNKELRPGESWRDKIYTQLKGAKAILVLWSKNSVDSEWVFSEAQIGADENKLIPVILDDIGSEAIPLPFNVFNTVSLKDWSGDSSNRAWLRVIEALMRLSKRTIHPSTTPPKEEVLRPGERVLFDTSKKYALPFTLKKKRVFIAHASADKPAIRQFVETFVDVGFDVWIDKPYELATSEAYLARLSANRIHYGADWKESIRLAIKKCDRVVAFWSLDAVRGRREQFHYEVYQGLIQSKLRQCRIDKVDYIDIGFPYTFHHIADLSIVSGTQYHQAFQDLISDIATKYAD